MSILIKGIDMPKNCGECEFVYNLVGGSYEWWECAILHDDINQFDTRRTDCPLVEIPTPHGRLIDADEFTDVCEILADKGGDIRPWEQAEWIAKDMPTILEAEDETAYTIQADSDTVIFKNNGENQF